MKSNRFLGAMVVTAVIALALPSPAPAQGVVGDFSQVRTEAVGDASPVLGEWVRSEMVSVPADDSGKWQFLIFCGPNCSPCERLKHDWKNNANLKALADESGSAWGWLNVYEAANKSQAFRFKDYQVNTTPVIVVAPPANTKQWPYFTVFREEGYNGDPDGLAKRMVAAIKSFCQKHRPRPSPDVPTPDPTPPAPSPVHPNPVPTPLVTPNVIPILPNFPPLFPVTPVPTPNPTPGPGPVPGPGPKPDYPDGLQVAIVLADPGNILERAELKVIRSRLEAFKQRYKLSFDIRVLKLADAAKRYPVTGEDLPAIFVTEGGRLIVKASIGLLKEILDTQDLEALADKANLHADPAPEPRTTEEKARALLRGIVELIAWIPTALGWAGWLVVIAIVVALVWRHRRPTRAATPVDLAMTPEPRPMPPLPAQTLATAPIVASTAESDASQSSQDWSGRPSGRAAEAVAAAQTAAKQANQARSLAESEVAAAKEVLGKEADAIAAAEQSLTTASKPSV